MAPALEFDIIATDDFSKSFDKLDAKARQSNRSIAETQRGVQQLQTYLSLLGVQANATKSGGFTDMFSGAELGLADVIKKLPAGVGQGAETFEELAASMSEYMDNAKAAAEETENLKENLEALGPVDLSKEERWAEDFRAGMDRLKTGYAELEQEMSKPLPSLLDQEVPLFPALRALDSLPGVQIPALQALHNILPVVTVRTVALAAGFAGLAAAGYAAVQGLEAVWGRMQALEVTNNLKQKIGVTFETAEVDAAISQVQDDLDDRLSKDKVMQILLQVDPTSALADLDKFGALAAVVQGYADTFGLSWEQSFTGIAEAIEGGNGAYLEQVGAITSADQAYLNYAKAQGKNVSQLTALDKQQALYNATLEKLGSLADPAASSVDRLREATEQTKAAFSDAGTAFGNWVIALLDPTAGGLADWWAGKLNALTGTIRDIEAELTASSIANKIAATLSPEDLDSFNNLRDERGEITARLASEKAQLANAEWTGNKELIDDARAEIAALEVRLTEINAQIKQAGEDAAAGRPIADFGEQDVLTDELSGANEEIMRVLTEYTSKLTAERQQLALATKEVTDAEAQLSTEDFVAAFNAGDTRTIDRNQELVDAATNMRDAAAARVALLEAEQGYLVAQEQLNFARAIGNQELEAAQQITMDAAAATLEVARQGVVATNQLDIYTESVARVGKTWEEAGAASAAVAPDFVPVDQWQAAIDRFREGVNASPIVIPTLIGAPTQEEAAAATVTNGNATDTRFDTETALSEARDRTTEATYRQLAASDALRAANAAAAVAANQVKDAESDYATALAFGTEAQTQAADAGLRTAKAKQQTAVEAAQLALAEYNAAKAAVLSAQAVSTNASANEVAADAAEQNAEANDHNAESMRETAMVAGMAVDAVSGLPVAFNAAELNAKQLEAALVDLEIQLMNIEAAAANVGFSIAQRLIPTMGIAGAVGQGVEWAGQARQVRETFQGINEARLEMGQDPLGKEVLDASMNALTSNWQAYATDATASMDQVGGAAKAHGEDMNRVAEQINDAIDGMARGVLKDSTQGLIDLDSMLPRLDTVDENARRMADVAVKGFQSPWYEGLKAMFAPEVFEGGEAAVKQAAAEMVRAHQKGLTTMLYDADAAAKEVFEQIQAKQKTDEFVAEIREKVKAMGADVEGFDIKTALGIELDEEDVAQRAGGAARRSAMSQVLSFEEIIAQMQALGQETESPIVDILEPKEGAEEKIKGTGKDAISLVGDAMVTQATEGKYGERSITAVITQLKSQEVQLKASGVTLADWLGNSMVNRFENNVPARLLEILVTNLVPLMAAQTANDEERTSSTTGS